MLWLLRASTIASFLGPPALSVGGIQVRGYC